ncbi:MAG: cysteate synthase, partial [Bacteroidetes bacterium CG_4_10_14_3_um_filter_42_6]
MPHPSEKTPFQLQSVATGNIFNDTGWLLDAPGEKIPTLIRALYQTKQLQLKDPSFGIYRFADWLPVNRYFVGSSAPIT